MTLRISEPKNILELAPGEVYTGELHVENPTEEDAAVKIYVEDWAYTSAGNGEKEFAPAGTMARSASPWLVYTPSDASVKPFGRLTVRYTIKVPQDAKGGYYSVVFFESELGTTLNEEGASVNVHGRIGSLFLIEIRGTSERKGEIQSIDITPPKGNRPMEIKTAFRNSGNVDIALGGNFLILDKAGLIKGRGEIEKIYTFPGAISQSVTPWVGRLEPGSYQVLLTYDLGKGKNLVEEKTLVVTP